MASRSFSAVYPVIQIPCPLTPTRSSPVHSIFVTLIYYTSQHVTLMFSARTRSQTPHFTIPVRFWPLVSIPTRLLSTLVPPSLFIPTHSRTRPSHRNPHPFRYPILLAAYCPPPFPSHRLPCMNLSHSLFQPMFPPRKGTSPLRARSNPSSHRYPTNSASSATLRAIP